MPKIRKPAADVKPTKQPRTLNELYDDLEKVRLVLVRQINVLYGVTAGLAERGVEGYPPIEDDCPF